MGYNMRTLRRWVVYYSTYVVFNGSLDSKPHHMKPKPQLRATSEFDF